MSSSQELFLTINLFNYNLFIPEILFFLFFLFKKKNNYLLLLLCFIFLLTSFFSIYQNSFISNKIYQFLNSFDIIMPFLIIFSLNKISIFHCRLQLLVLIILLSVQLIYYSITGVPNADYNYYGEFYRISTTIGSPTTTSFTLILLSYLVSILYSRPLLFWFFSGISLLTFSKAGLFILILLLLFGTIKITFNFKVKYFKYVIFISSLLFFFSPYLFMFIESLNDRLSRNFLGNGLDSGRLERIVYFFNYFDSINFFYGFGPGYIVPYPRMTTFDLFSSLETFSPHNTLVLILIENGLLALIIFIFILFYIFKNFIKNRYIQDKLFWILIIINLYFIEIFSIRMEIGFLTYLALIYSYNAKKNSPFYIP